MNNPVPHRANPVVIGSGILMLVCSLPCIWVMLDLPGVTGGSGSIWEKAMVTSFGLTALCFGLLMIRLGVSDRDKWSTLSTILALGTLMGFGGAFWATYERALEMGMILPI